MLIAEVRYAEGFAGWVHEDIGEVRAGQGVPEVSRVVSVMLLLESGAVATGDCVDVAFAGAVGRAPRFRPAEQAAVLAGPVRDFLRGSKLLTFRDLAAGIEELRFGGAPLHPAIRYGVSQAVLQGVALARGLTMAEVAAEEYGFPLARAPIDLLCSCGTDDHGQVDRMILKRVALLPNWYVTDVATQVGKNGSILEARIAELATRIARIGPASYHPRLRFDCNGALGALLDDDLTAVAELCQRLGRAAAPFGLMLESPIVMRGRMEQIRALAELQRRMEDDIGRVRIGADEWCNTLEDIKAFADGGAGDYLHIKMPDLGSVADVIAAVSYCHGTGMKACLGGSANETDVSARVAAHVALATRPDHMLARPGLGGDEAIMMQHNEMARALALFGGGVSGAQSASAV